LVGKEEYVVEGRLGEGGAGVVYATRHLATGERRAVKVLSRRVAGSFEFEARLWREAEIQSVLAALSPHIARIHEWGCIETGDPFYAMDLLDGQTLQDALDDGPLPASLACGLVYQALGALDVVHAAGIVHRDVKPSNLFLTSDGVVKLLDFGFAKVVAGHERFSHFATGAAQALGTARYLPPEAGRDDLDARADVYAAGVVLAELPAGELPFAKLGNGEWFARLVERGFPMPPGLPEWLRPVVARATANDPDARYSSAAEFAAHLGWACQRAGVDLRSARPLSRPAPAGPRVPAFGPRAFVVSGVAVAAAALAVVMGRPSAPADAQVAAEPRPAGPAAAAPPPVPSAPAQPLETPTAKASAPSPRPSASASPGLGGERARLESKLQAGQGTVEDAKALAFLCRRQGDKACQRRARAAAEALEGKR
jgi:eukaryotic-like serine/threonine-protein kinase